MKWGIYMRTYDLIQKKRDKEALSKDEIEYMVRGYTNGNIPDYQMSAFLMAVYLNGMNEEEILNLTLAMADSGERLELDMIDGVKVDKHSTGGVGDKTTLIVAPIVAACGIPVAKMSGRGLGHTGGTIDKLESIPGYRTTISTDKFINNVNRIKIAIVGQTVNLAPADKKIYALRDVTATVESIPLISSSIMSKKLASGADAIVLDVKTGSGAFMKNENDAVALANEMVKIGRGAGKNTIAVVTDMNEPLGNAVGNALEVIEAIETLKGNGPDDLTEISVELAGHMIVAAGESKDIESARRLAKEMINSGKALGRFRELLKAQGGNTNVIEDYTLFPQADIIHEVKAEKNGYISRICTSDVGVTSLILGGGRETKESVIDLSVGIIMKKKIGDKVNKGDIIALLYANDKNKVKEAEEKLLSAYDFSDKKPEEIKLIKRIIE